MERIGSSMLRANLTFLPNDYRGIEEPSNEAGVSLWGIFLHPFILVGSFVPCIAREVIHFLN